MPVWLENIGEYIGLLVAIMALLRIWLNPVFKFKDRVKKLEERIEIIEEHQKKDYEARLTMEKLQKAEIKALIAILNNYISGLDVEKLKQAREELQNSIFDNM